MPIRRDPENRPPGSVQDLDSEPYDSKLSLDAATQRDSLRQVSSVADKVCAACGRRFAWRRKWAANWEHVRYCSSGCRTRGLRRIDSQLEDRILELVRHRGPGKTLCPSEVARSLVGTEQEWRALLEPTRRAARRLAHRGEIEITQRGHPVDPNAFRGPIRLRLRAKDQSTTAPR